jgi:TRAP-type C4-dicarboxylate transport system permease small subunit
MNIIQALIARAERISGAFFHYATAALLFVLMILTCADVLGRYFFNRPVYGGFELTEVVLALMIFCALPLVTSAGEHVTVDLVTIPGRYAQIAQNILTNIAGFLVAGVLARQLWLRAERLGKAGETTQQIEIPLSLVTYSMSILMGLTALFFLLRAFRKPSEVPPANEFSV